METIKLAGQVDQHQRLSALVPDSIPPGPVVVLIVPAPPEEDAAGNEWLAGIADQWSDELSDTRQDIYTLDDGEPIRESE